MSRFAIIAPSMIMTKGCIASEAARNGAQSSISLSIGGLVVNTDAAVRGANELESYKERRHPRHATISLVSP